MKPQIVWPWHKGSRVLSLDDMIRFLARDFLDAFNGLKFWRETIQQRVGSLPKKSKVRRAQIARLNSDIAEVRRICGELELVVAHGRCQSLLDYLMLSQATLLPDPGLGLKVLPPDFSIGLITNEISEIERAAWTALGDRKFAFIPPGKCGFYEQDGLFGDKVSAAFPSAKDDIKDAGNCLAMGLHTAAVFHLMGVTNAAIMALGRHLKVNIRNIEHHDWKPILAGIGAKLEKAHGLKRGPKKQREVEFYAEILGELNALKDVHRNAVFHSQKRYNEPEALGVCERVKALMQRLAERLPE